MGPWLPRTSVRGAHHARWWLRPVFVSVSSTVATKKKKSNPWAVRLAKLAKEMAKAKPKKLHRILFDAFEIVAAAGDVPRATTIVGWMYGSRSPAPTDVASALSTAALDGFCHAAKLGDRTGGLPRHERTVTSRGPLAERVAEAETTVRGRLTMNAYSGELPTTDAWMKKKLDDPWRSIDRWRRIQRLVDEGNEKEALARIADLLDDLAPDQRGAAYGDELVLALDLALRNGGEARIPAWLARHGHRFESESFLIQSALCLPAVAASIVRGDLRETIGLSEGDLDAAMKALDEALTVAMSAVPATAIPKVQKRRVTCEYSQVHLGPETLDATEKEHVHFQKPDDSAKGMSLFPTMVGIGTPTDTDYVDVEISLSNETKATLDGVVQAVTFPITVRGPLLLSSVTGDDEDPFVVPNGSYDVLARFLPKKAPKASSKSALRVFTLLLTFHPAGALGAPKTLRMES